MDNLYKIKALMRVTHQRSKDGANGIRNGGVGHSSSIMEAEAGAAKYAPFRPGA